MHFYVANFGRIHAAASEGRPHQRFLRPGVWRRHDTRVAIVIDLDGSDAGEDTLAGRQGIGLAPHDEATSSFGARKPFRACVERTAATIRRQSAQSRQSQGRLGCQDQVDACNERKIDLPFL